ncbi:hypothetical protein FSP39_011568 [Pinctada imbricata]|uniref:Uncharacterized protein n=1 Tax=Pinctada imbricata TaxID=66713 RepID=A0AA89BVR8_PINIB|nr:hypothetical protein FSP39_011568 [Pinctada imbricata]
MYSPFLTQNTSQQKTSSKHFTAKDVIKTLHSKRRDQKHFTANDVIKTLHSKRRHQNTSQQKTSSKHFTAKDVIKTLHSKRRDQKHFTAKDVIKTLHSKRRHQNTSLQKTSSKHFTAKDVIKTLHSKRRHQNTSQQKTSSKHFTAKDVIKTLHSKRRHQNTSQQKTSSKTLNTKNTHTRENLRRELPRDLVKLRRFRWDDELRDLARESLIVDMDRLKNCIPDSVIFTEESVNRCVSDFSNCLTDLMYPFFEKGDNPSLDPPAAKCNDRVYSRGKYFIDKPWFNDVLKAKYRNYKSALYIFSQNKSHANHVILMEKKREYKALECTLKRQYTRSEGNMLEEMRKRNPKNFYRIFKRKKASCNVDDFEFFFFEHFRKLSEDFDETRSPVLNN